MYAMSSAALEYGGRTASTGAAGAPVPAAPALPGMASSSEHPEHTAPESASASVQVTPAPAAKRVDALARTSTIAPAQQEGGNTGTVILTVPVVTLSA
jgi:hypothetical protein